MAIDEYFQESMLHHEMEDSDEKPWQKSVSASSAKAMDNTNDCFQCNICLDHANEPVVTLCGHLYCWPCIYKWLHLQSASATSDQQQQCPVCKAEVSQSMVVPLYGRGNSLPRSESNNGRGSFPGLEIPCRPPAHGVHAVLTTTTANTTTNGGQVPGSPFQTQSNHHQQYYPEFYNQTTATASPMSNSLGGSTTTATTRTASVHPMVGMFGEMVYARIFGNGTEMGLFVHPNSYYFMGNNNSSPRVRRQEMKAEKSLNRISIFLFCCLALCLLCF